jgi:sialic acid synthase SpsE
MTIQINDLLKVMESLNHNDSNTFILLYCRSKYISKKDNCQLESLLYNLKQIDRRLNNKLIYDIITNEINLKSVD